MFYVALQGKTNQSLNRTLANWGAQLRAYKYYVTVCLSHPTTKQF